VGDLNSYGREDPIRILEEAGWVDAFGGDTTGGDADRAAAGLGAGPIDAAPPYSYVFQGQAGRLDHALLHHTRVGHRVQAAKWHTNADEDAGFGYDAELARARAEGRPPRVTVWRSSDHDPMVVTVYVGMAR
jgi:predicted extracellular nuclease